MVLFTFRMRDFLRNLFTRSLVAFSRFLCIFREVMLRAVTTPSNEMLLCELLVRGRVLRCEDFWWNCCVYLTCTWLYFGLRMLHLTLIGIGLDLIRFVTLDFFWHEYLLDLPFSHSTWLLIPPTWLFTSSFQRNFYFHVVNQRARQENLLSGCKFYLSLRHSNIYGAQHIPRMRRRQIQSVDSYAFTCFNLKSP